MTISMIRAWLLVIAFGMLAAACGARRDTSLPLPTALIRAPQSAVRLVVVLPGRGDDLAGLQSSGIAQAVHDVWPDADVQLAEVTLGDYREGKATRRLHDEVIAPARSRGYRQIWLGGASMGGMGTLLYDIDYPGMVDGLLLFAPYLGDRAIIKEIVAAGGVASWNPGPAQPMGPDTFQREMWRHLKNLSSDPVKARRVWLAYGDGDRLRHAIAPLVPVLPVGHVIVRSGGHSWSVWTPAMRELLRATEFL